jgi:hypothetical protein
MKLVHLHLAALPPELMAVERPAPGPWWLAPEFLALAELRRAMVGGAAPASAATTPEESARHAVFWTLFQVEHLIRCFVARVEAGASVRLRSSNHRRAEGRVDFSLHIVEQAEIAILPPARGAR